MGASPPLDGRLCRSFAIVPSGKFSELISLII